LQISEAVDISHNSNPLTVLVAAAARLSLDILYNRRAVPDGDAEEVLAQLARLLSALPGCAGGGVGSLHCLLEDFAAERGEAQAGVLAATIRERLRSKVRRNTVPE
jgi:hypothetical protein